MDIQYLKLTSKTKHGFYMVSDPGGVDPDPTCVKTTDLDPTCGEKPDPDPILEKKHL